MTHRLEPLFRPRSIAFIGGSNVIQALRYQRELGYTGKVWAVNPNYDRLDQYDCVLSVEDLPEVPDLAFVAIRRELAVETIAKLREMGCRAVICNAAGFAESGGEGLNFHAKLLDAAGDMPMLGPNVLGLVSFVDSMAAMMDHYGLQRSSEGVAIVCQGGAILTDAAYCDRSIPLTHLVATGNQVRIGVEECLDYLLDDPRVRAVGLSFEALHDVHALRQAAEKALRLGKPIVAMKLGKSEAGARASASHTASMTGAGAISEAIFDRLGIISTSSESEFLETLKLAGSGQIPKGPRVLVTSASGTYSVMLADHLSAAGFELPQPTGARLARLRELLPPIATPCNPQDVTMAIWGDEDRQRETYAALLDEGYDVVIGIQNYPRPGVGDMDEHAVPVNALGAAAKGRDVAAIQLAPLGDCFPDHAREHARSWELAPMQGLQECMAALRHALWWHERREQLRGADLKVGHQAASSSAVRGTLDEAAAKTMLSDAGISVPDFRVTAPENAHDAAEQIGYPVVLKALDSRLLHKTEVGAVRLGLSSNIEVREAVERMRADMARLAPEIPLQSVLVEAMTQNVVAEVMASVTQHPSVGPVLMIAGGGVEAELWNDSVLLAPPFTRNEIVRALDRLKVTARVRGWRGRPGGDYEGLVDTIEKLGQFALRAQPTEIEINPILVRGHGAIAVDAVLKFADSPLTKRSNTP